MHMQQAAAVAPTEWWVLEVTWDAEQLTQLFLAQTLRHERDRNGPGCFSFHGPLRLCDTAHFTVRRLISKATGLETWARFFLKPFSPCMRTANAQVAMHRLSGAPSASYTSSSGASGVGTPCACPPRPRTSTQPRRSGIAWQQMLRGWRRR
jgi:hypothetical protein